MLGVLEPGHLILILLVALLIFGPRKLPELGKSLGASLREFRNSTQGLRAELSGEAEAPRVAHAAAIPEAVQPVAAQPIIVASAAAAAPHRDDVQG